MSRIAIRKGDPKSPDGLALLTASHDLLQSLYPPEDNHFLSVDELCRPDITFILADLDDAPMGCAALANKGGYGEIKSMFVDPAARGSGIAGKLMDGLEAEARSQGLTHMKLETGDDLYAAHKLYQRHGFEICGAFGDYSEGPHSVFMQKTLS